MLVFLSEKIIFRGRAIVEKKKKGDVGKIILSNRKNEQKRSI